MNTLAPVFSGLCAVLVAPALAAMTLSSDDLQPGATIAPAQIYSRCGGANISPQLSWSGAPAGTKSFALTMVDVSVKPSQWSHWVLVDISPGITSLARGSKVLPAGAKAIKSNFGDTSYDGPCPPPGSGVHEYQITIWALPAAGVAIAPDMKATDLNEVLTKLALDHASLAGVVER
jgi:Raf kinase inhibitor-like YbhB/YbcL family protein